MPADGVVDGAVGGRAVRAVQLELALAAAEDARRALHLAAIPLEVHQLAAREVAAPRELLALARPALGARLARAYRGLARRELLAQGRELRDLAGPLRRKGRPLLARCVARCGARARPLLQRLAHSVALGGRPHDAHQRAKRGLRARARQRCRQVRGLRLRLWAQRPPGPAPLRRLQQERRRCHRPRI